jgi:hypothetical protein
VPFNPFFRGFRSHFLGLAQSDNYWLNIRMPALTYGLRGLVYFKLTMSGLGRDLHSGACMLRLIPTYFLEAPLSSGFVII